MWKLKNSEELVQKWQIACKYNDKIVEGIRSIEEFLTIAL